MRDTRPPNAKGRARERRFEIRDETGALHAIHLRRDKPDGTKTFRLLHPDGRPSRNGEIRPSTLPLYGVHDLPAANGDAAPIIVEGEKTRDALAGVGFVALATVTGASGTPDLDALRPLARFPRVLCWPDNDAPGRAHMQRVGEALSGLGVEVRYVAWREAPPKGDAADFIERGGTADEVRVLFDAATATPPQTETASATPRPAESPPHPAQRPTAIVRPFADIAPLPVEWLWDLRIPVGMPGLSIGDGGQGKGTTLCDIAARLSRGDRMPDGSGGGEPRVTLWVTAEDDPARTLRPRLDAAGANVNLVKLLTMRGTDGEERELVLTTQDLSALEAAIVAHKAALVILDPIAANVPAKVDSHRDEDLRRVLSPLAKVAGQTAAAILGVKHVGKDTTKDALQRILGATAWGASARSVLAVGTDPQDESGKRRILAHVKSNVGPIAESLAFRLVEVPCTTVTRVEWLGRCDVSARELLGAPMDAEERSAFSVALDILDEMLPPEVEVPAKTVEGEAKKRGVSHRTLMRARKARGVKSRQTGGPGTPWVLWLPGPGTLVDGTLGKTATARPQGPNLRQNATSDPGTLYQSAKPELGTLGGNGQENPIGGHSCQSATHQSATAPEWEEGEV